MHTNLYKEYIKTSIETSTPGQLISMAYGRLVHFLEQAIDSFESNDEEGGRMMVLRAEDALDVLKESLNLEFEVAKNLYALYSYMNRLLLDVGVKEREDINYRIEKLKEAKGLAVDLSEAWAAMLEKEKALSGVMN